jgi:hypothetical protein
MITWKLKAWGALPAAAVLGMAAACSEGGNDATVAQTDNTPSAPVVAGTPSGERGESGESGERGESGESGESGEGGNRGPG